MTIQGCFNGRVLRALITFVVAGCCVVSASHAQDMMIPSATAPPLQKIEIIERPEDQVFILEVVADESTILHKGMLVYLDGRDVMVPLSQMMEILQFPIRVDLATGRAQGWFLAEENAFDLRYPFDIVAIAGKDRPIKAPVEVHGDDIYVGIDTLSDWFPITVTLNYNQLRLYIRSDTPLPFKMVSDRRARWDRMRPRDGPADEDAYHDVVFPAFKNFALPAIQVSQGLNYSRPGGGGSTGVQSNTVQAYGDFLKHSARLNATYSRNFGTDTGAQDGLSNVLLNMTREDFRGNLLGPMRATSYEIGDVSSFNVPLASGQQRGRGGRVTNAPPNFVRDPAGFIVEGYAAAGWDAELYQDDRLIDFITIAPDGFYRFADIELREGFNVFRIALYGPNGEREDRFESVFLGPDVLEPGQFVYEAAVLESATPLFNIDKLRTTDPLVSITGEYGIGRAFSAYGSIFSGPLGVGETRGFGGGLRGSLGRSYAQLNLYKDMDAGQSAGLSATGNISKSLSWAAGHTRHDGYDDDERTIIRETFARLSKMFSFKFLPQSTISLEMREDESSSNVATRRVTNRFSTAFRGLSMTHALEYSKTDTPEIDADIDGALTLSYRLGDGVLRGRVNYDVRPEGRIENSEIQYQLSLDEASSLNLGLVTEWSGSRVTSLRAGWNRQFEKFQLGINGGVNSESDVNFGINLTYNFIPRKQFGDYYMTGSAGSLSSGVAQMRPFIDENGNNIYDVGEATPEGIVFRNAQRGTRATTQADGLAYLDGLNVNAVNRVEIDTKSLPDLYMEPGKEAVKIFGKTGVAGPIDYPIRILGEVTGILYAVGPDGSEVPVTGHEMMLVDAEGKVVAQAFSEYDGFFIFSALPLGLYRLYFPGLRTDGPEIALTAGAAILNDMKVILPPVSQ